MTILLLCVLLLAPPPWAAAASEADLFSEAESRYLGRTWAAALATYDSFLESYPNSGLAPDARYRRAVCLVRLERWQEASDALREVSTRWRMTRWIEYVPLWQGVAQYHLGSWSLAVGSLDQFLARVTDAELTPQALLHKALCLISLEDPAGAAGVLRRMLKDWPQAPSRPYAIVLLGTLLARAAAWAELAALTAEDPSSLPDAWREQYLQLRAEALWETGSTAAAAELSRRLVGSRDDAVARVSFQRLFAAAEAGGDLASMQSLTQTAEARFSSAPEVLAELWTRTGLASYRRGNRELADYFLTRVWDLRARVAVGEIVPLYLAQIRIDREDAAAARSVLETFLASGAPNTGAAVVRLGDIALSAGDYAGAVGHYTRFLELHPDSGRRDEVGYLIAFSRYRQGRFAEALDLANRFLQPPGAYATELRRLRIALLKKAGRLAEALGAADELVKAEPRDARAQLERMKLLFQLGRIGELPEAADSLLAAAPTLVSADPYTYYLALYFKGLGQATRKEWRGAMASLEAISPSAADKAGLGAVVPWARYYLGWAAVRAGSLEMAARVLDELTVGSPRHEVTSKAQFMAGWAYFGLQAWDRAADRFSAAAKATDADLAARAGFLRARSLQNAGTLAEAATAFLAIADARPPGTFADDAALEYANLQSELGAHRAAADAFDRLVRDFPESPFVERSLYARGTELLAAGRASEAQAAFAQYRRTWPKGAYVDASWYGSAEASLKAGERVAAVLAWEQIIASFPNSPFRASSLQQAAEAYVSGRELAKALALYDRLIAEYPEEAASRRADIRAEELRYQLAGTTEREAELLAKTKRESGAAKRDAMVELARLYVLSGQQKKADEGLALARQVAAEATGTVKGKALAVVGEYWYRKGRLDEAAQQFLDAATAAAADPEVAASSIYRAAEMVKLAGRPEDLLALVRRLEERWPSSAWTTRARKLLEAKP